MPIRCPNCGALLDLVPIEQLSPAARHILNAAPRRFLNGQQLPLREIARFTGYSIGSVYAALRELSEAGYVERQPIGRRKHIYRGKPHNHS